MFPPALALLALVVAGAPSPPPERGPDPVPRLEDLLLRLVAEARLDELLDAGPDEARCAGPGVCRLRRARFAPTLDLAVIRLDARGRAVEAANVQVDAASPRGRLVKLDERLAATGVRFRRWNAERYERAGAGPPFEDREDVVRDGDATGRDVMSPYPASLFKLLVAFHIEKRAAEGAFPLSAEARTGPGADALGRSVSGWLDAMIGESDNLATMALLRFLHQRGEVDQLNADLAALGLTTLRIDATTPEDGGWWIPGEINVTAMDAARLLWLVAGGPGLHWNAASGRAVVRETLPEEARARLKSLLAGQGIHEVLSSGSLCGVPPFGIPALVPTRFLDPGTGVERVGPNDYGRDVRPCNASAEVRFLHKTGLTWGFAADAGLVEPLPGKPFRRYVVALVSSVGTRYVDPERGGEAHHPCQTGGICVTRRLAKMGAAIDAWAEAAAERDRRAR